MTSSKENARKASKKSSSNHWFNYFIYTRLGKFLIHVQTIIIIGLLCVWLIIERNMFWTWIKGHTDSALIVTLFATIVGALIVKGVVKLATHLRFYTRPYITFEADNTQVFRLSKEIPLLEYSVGEKAWKKLGTQNIVFGGNRGKLLLRGQSIIGTYGANISFATQAQVICTGDIRTLIDYKNYSTAITSLAVFSYLFYECSQLVVAPNLPSMDLAKHCYSVMFGGCTSLKTPPELPAKVMAADCYSSMFSSCTSLKTAPELPATVLAENCYSNMFFDCTSIKTAPKLPAKDLAVGCYFSMFQGCISLNWLYPLPALELVDRCYGLMFAGCTSLEIACELPAQKLAESCYSSMFSNCSSLKKAPELNATELCNGCYTLMFNGCTSLSEITMMAVDIPNPYCFYKWIENTSLEGIFYKNKDARWENEGIIPQKWKVESIDSSTNKEVDPKNITLAQIILESVNRLIQDGPPLPW